MDQGKPSTDTPSIPAQVGRTIRERTTQKLAGSPDALAVADVAATAMHIAEDAFADAQRDPAVQDAVANLHCRKYCAHCCYKSVSVTPAEVVRLAVHLKAALRPKPLAKLKARLHALDDKTRGMTPAERSRARLPCALLVGRLCIAHAARPASCRGFNSRDVRACEKSVRQSDVQIPVYRLQYQIFAEAYLGLRQGLAGAGLTAPHLELTAALRIALDTPDATERWLAGEPVFRAAELN